MFGSLLGRVAPGALVGVQDARVEELRGCGETPRCGVSNKALELRIMISQRFGVNPLVNTKEAMGVVPKVGDREVPSSSKPVAHALLKWMETSQWNRNGGRETSVHRERVVDNGTMRSACT